MAQFEIDSGQARKCCRLVPLLLASALLAGCGHTSGLYDWGGYDDMLYRSYKNPETSAEMRVGIEAHLAEQEKINRKVAPGLYAELGTLYFQAGDRDRALQYYRKEEQAWPESRSLMAALIRSIERREGRGAPSAPSAPAEPSASPEAAR